jgi:hypothetical protein
MAVLHWEKNSWYTIDRRMGALHSLWRRQDCLVSDGDGTLIVQSVT